MRQRRTTARQAGLGLLLLLTVTSTVLGAWLVESSPSIGRLLFAVGILGVNLILGAVITQSARRGASGARRVEALVRDHHKTASKWDWRVRGELAEIRKQIGSPGHKDVDGSAWKRHPRALGFLETGVLDPEFYAAFVGTDFDLPVEAAAHYLTFGIKNLEPPSVLLNPEVLPESVKAAMRRGDESRLLDYLRSEAGVTRPLSERFFPAEIGATVDVLRRYPGGALGYFAATTTATAPLPVPSGSPASGATLDEVRRAAIELAVTIHESRSLTGPRTLASWDSRAEHAWLASVREATQRPRGLVSVIMPVRDRVGIVESAIQSVRAQTHDDWQLIVVDDGSTDGTRELVESIAAGEPRISLVSNTSAGVSSARNAGLAKSHGDFVAFLDSDNQWVPHFLEVMLRGMALEGHDVAYAASASRDEDGKESYRAFTGGLDHLLLLNHIDLNVMVVRGAIARETGFDQGLRRWVDHDFVIRVARKASPHLLPFIGCLYDDSRAASDRITVRESEHWQWVVLGKHWVDFAEAHRAPAVPGRVSVVIPTYNDASMTLRSVRSVLADPSGGDIEVIVVDNGSTRAVSHEIATSVVGDPRVRHLRLPRNFNFAIGCNYGAAQATGEYLFFLNNDTILRPGVLEPLVSALHEDASVRGAQPLLVYPDDTVQTSGTVFVARDSLPVHLLVGHPQEDSAGVDAQEFAVVTAAALMVRRAEFLELEGFDPIFVNGMEDVDYCLRAGKRYGGFFRVRTEARVTHFESKTPGRSKNIGENRRLFMERWRGRLPSPQDEIVRGRGFEVTHVGSDFSAVPAPRPVLARRDRERLRWSLKIASIPGARGDLWGDTHFAESLAEGLRALGNTVVTYRHGAHEVPATAFDDVVLSLRGLDRVAPMPGKTNVLWVISHPERVTADELSGFDVVLAASEAWAAKMAASTGRLVLPLLQATDDRLFSPAGPRIRTHGAVFVGGSYGRRGRRVVTDALEAGIPLRVYGPDWEGLLPPGVHAGDYVENGALSAVYRGADYVLADHWEDMAREGFIQNRLFDAVAAGARVITDPVDGVEELFEGAVQSYRSIDELAALCTGDESDRFPDDAQMTMIAERVRSAHSFGRRARELEALVSRLSIP